MEIYKEKVVGFFQILLDMRWEMDPKSGFGMIFLRLSKVKIFSNAVIQTKNVIFKGALRKDNT